MQLINSTKENPLGLLRSLLVDSSWMREEAKAKLMENPLMRLCAHYLFVEKRRGFALDSVGKSLIFPSFIFESHLNYGVFSFS